MGNNLDQFSDEELNLVTDYILKSAKKRFDYKDFKVNLPPYDEDFIDYNILSEIIEGKTLGESNEDIASKIFSTILLSGFMIERDDIIKMISQKEKELGLEIVATRVAMESLQKGAHPSLVIQQLSTFL